MSDATRHSRRIPPGLRRELFEASGGSCPVCQTTITLETFHCAHLRAASHGGPPIRENLQAQCCACNLKNGNHDVSDPRVPLRAWQQEALPFVIERLTMGQVATVMAAPGAGKTLFAGAVFARGQDAGLWDRLLVLVPRLPLVKQWERALQRDCHIALDTHVGARQFGLELRQMDGLCTTYQAFLTADVRERHRHALQSVSTLVILDEVHHLGQRVHDMRGGAWASALREVVGDERTGLQARVLNLSGTLFRTSPKERISTVRYQDVVGDHGEARIQAIADYEIHPERLVREGLLRAPDLFRMGAKVDLVNVTQADVTVGRIADLTEGDARVALAKLNLHDDWVRQLVKVTLDQLQHRFQDSKRKWVKALIVTHRQDMARRFAAEVDRQMAARGLDPLAECVVSADGPDAYRRLENFRRQERVGVLCTVGMAGEGYDCPAICVVTYATNVLTTQSIRQVVARGQRVTPWEREKLGHTLTTAIILPDVPELIEQFTGIFAPMVHNIEVQPDQTTNEVPPMGGGPRPPGWSDKDLVAVRDPALDIVSAVSTGGTFDADPGLEELLLPALQQAELPGSWWPRFAQVLNIVNQQRPFDVPILGEALSVSVAERADPLRRPLTTREQHDIHRKRLRQVQQWWAYGPAKNGGLPISHFMTDVKGQIGIRDLDQATPEQLRRASLLALARVRRYCEERGEPLPRWAQTEDQDQ
jgi:superfamily II DNA or RNA helicase